VWKAWLGPLAEGQSATGDEAHENRADECSRR
jgi:hypothetical protein